MSRIFFFIGFLLLLSCTSKKDIIYFGSLNPNMETKTKTGKATITKNDILSISISSPSSELAKAYNTEGTAVNSGFLVGSDGQITMPILGKISVTGMSCYELEQLIVNFLISGNHLANPIVSVRIINSKVTVLGEVNKPGTYNFQEETISLLQALGYAGDLTINGVRNEIYIIREEGSALKYNKIDMTSQDWFSSDFYYIKPNDIIYVMPNDAKVKTGGYIKSLGNLLTIVSVTISTLVLILFLAR